MSPSSSLFRPTDEETLPGEDVDWELGVLWAILLGEKKLPELLLLALLTRSRLPGDCILARALLAVRILLREPLLRGVFGALTCSSVLIVRSGGCLRPRGQVSAEGRLLVCPLGSSNT